MWGTAHLRTRLTQSASYTRAPYWRCAQVARPAARAYFLAMLLCLLLLFSGSDAIAQVVGSVTKVQKQAQVGSTPAEVGTPVSMNAQIRTGPGARLQITFRDETVLTLGENATVVVDRYVYNPDTSTGALALNASTGALRFATGKLGSMTNKDVKVITPEAALAVRGTEFWAGYVPGDYMYGVLTLSGTVEASNSINSVTIPAGNGADLPPSLKDEAGFTDAYPWPEDKIARALSTTAFGLAFGPQNLLPAALLAIPFALQDDDERPRRPRPVSP